MSNFISHLEDIGFKTQGQCTRKSISNALELCYMHFDGSMRIQTIMSGFTEPLAITSISQVEDLILMFSNLTMPK